MASKLSHSAKNALSLAKLEAKRYNLIYIGTELVLLALSEERGSVAQRLFEELGVSARKLRQEVESSVLMGEEPLRPGQVIRAAPLVRRVVEIAKDEAKRAGNDEIQTEHLLLALIRERNGVASEVIDNLGLDRAALRKRVVEFVEEAATAKSGNEDADDEDHVWEAEYARTSRTKTNIDSEPEIDDVFSGPKVYARTEETDNAGQVVKAAAMVLKSVCEKYMSLKRKGKSELELLNFLVSVLKGNTADSQRRER